MTNNNEKELERISLVISNGFIDNRNGKRPSVSVPEIIDMVRTYREQGVREFEQNLRNYGYGSELDKFYAEQEQNRIAISKLSPQPHTGQERLSECCKAPIEQLQGNYTTGEITACLACSKCHNILHQFGRLKE